MRTGLIITAAGSGERFGTDSPKQYALLKGRPLLSWTLECFPSGRFDRVIVTSPAARVRETSQIAQSVLPGAKVVAGGQRRQDSIAIAARQLEDTDRIFIHDGVRPIVTPSLLDRIFEQAPFSPAVVPALPITDTLRRFFTHHSETVDRSNLYAIQTPQVFETSRYLSLLQRSETDTLYTDDASLWEQYFPENPLTRVEGCPFNIKVTWPRDLVLAGKFIEVLKS